VVNHDFAAGGRRLHSPRRAHGSGRSPRNGIHIWNVLGAEYRCGHRTKARHPSDPLYRNRRGCGSAEPNSLAARAAVAVYAPGRGRRARSWRKPHRTLPASGSERRLNDRIGLPFDGPATTWPLRFASFSSHN
jgi:hypothetical protein